MDKRFFEQAAREMINGSIDVALMAKAIAMSQGEEAKAKAAYITLRAEELQSADRTRRLKSAALMAATATGAGTVLASQAAVSATYHLWPVLVKTGKILLWIAAIFIAVSILLHTFLQRTIGSLASTGQLTESRTASAAATIARPASEFRPLGYSLGKTQNQQNRQYDSMLDELERKYPPLNPNSSQFNQSAVAQLESLVAAYEHQGMAGPVALQRAALQITNIRVLIPMSSKVNSNQAMPPSQTSQTSLVSSSNVDYDNPHNRECWRQYQKVITAIPESTPLDRFSRANDAAETQLAKCVRR